MAWREPQHYGAGDTIVHDTYAHVSGSVGEGGREPQPDEPIQGWRKPIALVGWGVLVALLLGLIIWGIVQLVRGAPPREPATTIAPTATSATSTTPPSSAAPVAPPTRHRHQETTSTAPTASTENSGTPTTTTSSPSPGAFPFPQLPSVITLPSLPGLPTEIRLPPGL